MKLISVFIKTSILINLLKIKIKFIKLKQNPYNMSPNISKILNKNNIKQINNEAEYIPILDSVIAKNAGVKSKNTGIL